MQEWNFLKDVGIAAATLIIFGRIMYELVQASIEFYRGVREDNKERNQQFETLLRINESIAGQMDLTRQAIEASTSVDERQNEAIRQSTAEVSALQRDLVAGLQTAKDTWSNQLQPVTQSLDHIVTQVGSLSTQMQQDNTQFGTQLSDTAKELLDDITDKLDDTETVLIRAVATTMLPVLDKLDMLAGQIIQTRQEVVKAMGHVVQAGLSEQNGDN